MSIKIFRLKMDYVKGSIYKQFSLPYSFRHGMQWQIGKENSYSVEHVGAQTVDGTNFADCIKVSYHTHDEDGYLGGTGYMILAKGVGIVKIEFNCNNGTTITFDYQEHRELTKHTISGTIVDSNSKAPVPEIAVQIAYNSWGTQAITDTEGKFSIQAYGPELCLMIGEDQDGILDHHKHVRCWVKEEDFPDLEIDLSTL